MKYTKQQLQEALFDMKEFIQMTKEKGTPIRLIICKYLIEKELMLFCDEKFQKEVNETYKE